MKQTFITRQFPIDEWNKLDPIEQRSAALNASDYWGSFTVISNEGTTWYVGLYHIRPFINYKTGKTYTKSICFSSGTIKNGKLYGNMKVHEMLRHIVEYFHEFEFAVPIINYLPVYAIVAVLSRKVTSQEDIWKMIAKRSYHDAHWKLVRTCKMNNVSFAYLSLACRDWEAFDPDRYDDKYTIRTLLMNAIILGEKVSCRWSSTRTSDEIQRMSRKLNGIKIAKLPKDPAWPEITLPNDWQLANTEADAYFVSDFFDNCVHNCYWYRIKEHKYVVFYNLKEALCVGYQIINNGEDALFDQIHGKHNSIVDPTIRTTTLDILRPIAQQFADYARQLPKAKENKHENEWYVL